MLSELCVRRPVFATMLVTSLVVLGIFSFRDLGVDLFPKADPATVNVSLRLPGASPDEMTTSVVMPMENALSGIAGIDQLHGQRQRRRHRQHHRAVRARARSRRRRQQRAREGGRRDAERAARGAAAGHPEAGSRRRPDHEHRASSSTSASLRTLTEIADKQVKRALESVDGVGDVTMSGDRAREIHIVVDVEKLNAHGLSIDQVRDAIQTGERRDSRRHARAGQVGGRPAHARPHRRHRRSSTTSSSPPSNGVPVRVADIGHAEDTVQKVATSLFMDDGAPAVQLDIRRASGENTIKVIEGVKATARHRSPDAAART